MSASMSARALSSKGACPTLPLRRAKAVKVVRAAARPVAAARAGKLSAVKDSVKPAQEKLVDQWWLMGAAFTTFMAPAQEAMAYERECGNRACGILEGKTIALTHPAIMFFLFGATFWAGYLGWQHRRTRTIAAEISDLKKQLPAADAEGNVPASPVQAQIDTLAATRKELVSGGFKDRHHDWGNLLLSLGVMTSVAGGMNTYIRVGKLFPGPHLFAGMAITVLWAAAAALVPYMQKGNEAARNAHITLNVINLCLFAWQVPTGIDIVLKVFQFAAWP